MLERALTTDCCIDIVRFLTNKLKWTIARIARTIGVPPDYVRRVQAGKQSFQLSDVEALARACQQEPHALIFSSVRRDNLSAEAQGLYDLTLKELERYREFRHVLTRRRTKKRRSPKSAA